MRIALASSQFPPAKTGYARIASELYGRFRSKGHEVELLTEGRGCRRGRRSIASLTQDGKALLDRGADIVQIIGPTPRFTEQCARYARRRGLKVVYTLNALPGLTSNTAGPIVGLVDGLYRGLILRPVVSAADRVVLNTRDFADSLGWHIARRVSTIPYGFDPSSCNDGCVRAARRMTGARRDEVGALPGITRILFVGQFRRYKGIPYLLEAARILRDRGQLCRLDLVGSGPESAKLGIEIRRLGLDSLVELHPQVSDAELHRFYSTSNVLVLPSLGAPESFGIVLLEGRAHGLRLVATDIPGVRELARHLGGVIVPPGDSRALASGIWAAVASPVPLEGGTSYTDLEREFSWDTVADRYLALYRRIATAATRGASDKSLGTSVSLAPSSLDAPPALGAGRR